MTAPLVFPFIVAGQEITPSRFAKGRRAHAGLEDDVTIVQLEPDCVLVPGFKIVKLDRPREPRTFLMGEILNGVERLTFYVETPIDLCAPGVMLFDSELPVRLIRSNDRAVHCHLPEGFGIMPKFTIARFTRSHWRHFIVGDVWRGQHWNHSVVEVPIPQRHPRRSTRG